jgi:hypothetical protein
MLGAGRGLRPVDIFAAAALAGLVVADGMPQDAAGCDALAGIAAVMATSLARTLGE